MDDHSTGFDRRALAPLDPCDLEDAEETLRQLEERLRRDARDMATVLRTDVPTFVSRTVKTVFEECEQADSLDPTAVRRLKDDTAKTSQVLGAEVGDRLARFELWTWDRSDPPPRDARGLDANPEVASVLRRVGEAVLELLERHGIPRSAVGEHGAYRLPTYFVAGHFMKSLVENYWQTLAMHHELRARIQSGAKDTQRKERRARWDGA
jgi:hypothetical protein